MSSLYEMRELLDELARVQVEAEFERGTFDIGRALKNLFRRHDSAEHRLLVLLNRTAEMGLDRSVIEQIAGRLPRRWTDPTAAAAPNEATPRGEFVRPAARHQPPPSGGSEVEEAEHQPPPSGGSEVEAAAAPQLEGTSITERAKEWYDPEFFEALPPLTSHSCSLLTSTCIKPLLAFIVCRTEGLSSNPAELQRVAEALVCAMKRPLPPPAGARSSAYARCAACI